MFRSPARVVRDLSEEEINHIKLNAMHYESLIKEMKE